MFWASMLLVLVCFAAGWQIVQWFVFLIGVFKDEPQRPRDFSNDWDRPS
jgi:hypothetical protein